MSNSAIFQMTILKHMNVYDYYTYIQLTKLSVQSVFWSGLSLQRYKSLNMSENTWNIVNTSWQTHCQTYVHTMLMVDLATTIHVAYLSANGELKKYCISSTRSHGSIQRVTQKWPCDHDVSVQSFKDGGIAEKSSARGHLPRESYRKSHL